MYICPCINLHGLQSVPHKPYTIFEHFLGKTAKTKRERKKDRKGQSKRDRKRERNRKRRIKMVKQIGKGLEFLV
jgi:hypothetical protein